VKTGFMSGREDSMKGNEIGTLRGCSPHKGHIVQKTSLGKRNGLESWKKERSERRERGLLSGDLRYLYRLKL